jgi:hypothetical protein
MTIFDRNALPSSSEDLLRTLGMIETRSPYPSALAGTAILAAGMLLGAGLAMALAPGRGEISTVPSKDERGVRPLTEV